MRYLTCTLRSNNKIYQKCLTNDLSEALSEYYRYNNQINFSNLSKEATKSFLNRNGICVSKNNKHFLIDLEFKESSKYDKYNEFYKLIKRIYNIDKLLK